MGLLVGATCALTVAMALTVYWRPVVEVVCRVPYGRLALVAPDSESVVAIDTATGEAWALAPQVGRQGPRWIELPRVGTAAQSATYSRSDSTPSASVSNTPWCK